MTLFRSRKAFRMRVLPTLVTVAVALLAAGCGSTAVSDGAVGAAGSAGPSPAATAAAPSPTVEAEPTAVAPATPDEAEATEGAWIDQATYEADKASYHAAGDVVLFFNASWCPTCQQTVRALDEQGAPPGLTVVSVDYDSADALRQQYQVTVQHTFVQVDEAGEQLAKFTGSVTGADIAGQTV